MPRLRCAPSSSRSATTWPPITVTIGERASARSDFVPARRRAVATPSRRGETQRSASNGLRTPGSVSATGPGPSTGPRATACGASVVMGRLCRSRTRSPSTAHSMSCGPPNTAAVRAASPARARRSRRPSPGRPVARSSRRPVGERASWMPSTRPDTSWSGPPSTAVSSRRSVRPEMGSAPNSTPPRRGCSIGWTRTAMGATSWPSMTAEASTSSTAATKASQPATSSTDWNRPAIDDEAPSSTVEDDRTTRARSGPAAAFHRPSRARKAKGRRHGSARAAAPRVVMTNPGRTGRPADAARASADALAPVSAPSAAPAWSSDTTQSGSVESRVTSGQGVISSIGVILRAHLIGGSEDNVPHTPFHSREDRLRFAFGL